MTEDPRTIRVDEFLPHPPEKVWRVLTEPELIARWPRGACPNTHLVP